MNNSLLMNVIDTLEVSQDIKMLVVPVLYQPRFSKSALQTKEFLSNIARNMSLDCKK